MTNSNRCFAPNWPAPAKVKAMQTTRLNGLSKAPYSSFNLAMHVADDAAVVEQNRQLLEVEHPIVWLEQVHGNNCVDLSKLDNFNSVPVADASITHKPKQVCVVMTADCLPVLLTDKNANFVAAVHCGWRGLQQQLLTQVIQSAIAEHSIEASDILVWFGPAIGKDAFEVGAEVKQAFVEIDKSYAQAFKPSSNQGKFLADIFKLASIELNKLNVTEIYSDFECTVTNSDKYFSYRKEGATGRQASLIWLE